MAIVLIIALLVVSIILFYLCVEQGKTIKKYEYELTKSKAVRAKKGK